MDLSQVYIPVIIKGQIFVCIIGKRRVLLVLRLFHRLELLDDVDDFPWGTKYVVDILEKEIRHEAPTYRFHQLEFAGYGKNLLRIQLDKFSILIFTNNWEEVQQLVDIRFPCVHVSLAGIGGRRQIIGKFLEYYQCSGWVKIENIGVMLTLQCLPLKEEAGILCPEGCLHVESRGFNLTS